MAATAEVSAFLEDLFENLGAIDAALARAEDSGATTEDLHEIFRAAHTIKGNASMMGLSNLVALGHALETALQEAISGTIPVTRSALSLFSECRNSMHQIGEMLRAEKDPGSVAIRTITDNIQVLLLSQTETPRRSAPAGERDVEIRLHIARAELAPSIRAFLVETKLAELGTIVRKEPTEEEIDTPAFLSSARQLIFVIHTRADAAEIRDNLNIDLIEDISIIEQEGATSTRLTAIVEQQKTEVQRETQASGGDTIRLSVSTLDRLLNLTGELVIANTGLTDIADEFAQRETLRTESLRLTEKNREIFRIAADIQNIVMKSRMLPVEHVFSRFRRFVRDYAEKTGKVIHLEMSGAETELDKRVIDEITKPLTHLIRNSLDHGLETPGERTAAGKNPEGNLRLSARQAGSHILISVEDDGRGLNLEKILARAIEKNLVSPDRAQSLSPEEIRNFIFMPGFSTKDAADDLSGRGFGMDIVRDSIKKLSGDLNVTSTAGRGTLMQIKLPLTLAIVTALTFRVRNDMFAIPLTAIEETLRVEPGNVLKIDGREILHNRDRMLPHLRLVDLLGYPHIDENADAGFAVVAALHGQKYAIAVDEFHRKQELVIKSLGENYRQVQGLAGAAMLGNDEIVFILDVEEIVSIYRSRHQPVVTGASVPVHTQQADNVAELVETMPAEVKTDEHRTGDPMSIRPMFDSANKDLIRSWISQSNKAAVKGMKILTGTSEISVRKSRGALVKPEKSKSAIERILNRADDIIMIHLPMLPAAGAIDLIIEKKSAKRMAQILFIAAGLAAEEEFDPSPLLEITNILGSAYTNTLTFLTETSVEPATPTLMSTPEEIKSMVEQLLLSPKAEILLVENQFHIANEDIEIELMIYLTGETQGNAAKS